MTGTSPLRTARESAADAPAWAPTLRARAWPPLAPTLVIGIGNPSRGDDALGSELLERLRALHLPDVELVADFQLQVEHVLDFVGRDEVIVVDADASCAAPFRFDLVRPCADRSITTHALSPAALLDVYARVVDAPLPPTWLLAIRGDVFELGAPLTAAASANLDAAVAMLTARLARTPMVAAPQ